MPRCPNCGQQTERTSDWACKLCGYPLTSSSFRTIEKTYRQVKEEIRGKHEVPGQKTLKELKRESRDKEQRPVDAKKERVLRAEEAREKKLMQPADESEEGVLQPMGVVEEGILQAADVTEEVILQAADISEEGIKPSKGMILFITLIMVTSSFLSGSLLTQINLVFGIILASVIVIGIGWSSATMIIGKVRLNYQLSVLLLLTVSALCGGIYIGTNYI